MKMYKRSFLIVIGLIVAASAALAYVGADDSLLAQLVSAKQPTGGSVVLHADLVQDKVLQGSDGQVAVAVTLKAEEIVQANNYPMRHVDLVIVMDRSGSMGGEKILDAKQAVERLIDRLTSKDRLALVTYANGVETISPLVPMNDENRRQVKAAVERVQASGGTNLGGGLQRGIQILKQTTGEGGQRRVVLISDGLANHGITDPNKLGSIAAGAKEHNLAVSTVGVGYDFNEVLMTTLADHGAGRYYFLEDPKSFATVFEQELEATRNVAASAMELRVPLGKGVQLVHAGGYPIQVKEGHAVVHPGDLLSGQQRKIFLTFQVPTDKEQEILLGTFHANYNHNGAAHTSATNTKMTLSCVKDPNAVMSSIDEPAWSEHVVQEDYSQLKEEVAGSIRRGEKDKALEQIRQYEERNQSINASVGSAVVTKNLKDDVQDLRRSVEDTFHGAPAAVAEKKKQRAKALQYEGYKIRRDKK